MMMTVKTKESLDRLLQKLFGGNARVDNLYYNLQYRNFINLANAIHEPVAHQLPLWADEVSELMDKLGGRPLRYGCPDNVEDYDVKAVFDDLLKYFEELREIVSELIENSDMQGDTEVCIEMEDFLNKKVMPFRRQAEEWVKVLGEVGEHDFNLHIKEYTHFIAL